MRLKTFYASTLAKALEQVRVELGRDAIIISTIEGKAGKPCQVTAALEIAEVEDSLYPLDDWAGEGPFLKSGAPTSDAIHEEDLPFTITPLFRRSIEQVRNCLQFHRVPELIIKELCNHIRTPSEPEFTTLDYIEELFTRAYAFSPLNITDPLMLVGTPGVGKSLAIAKIAAQAALEGRSVKVITTDTIKAGAVEQLSTYISALGQAPLAVVSTPNDLKQEIAKRDPQQVLLIDTVGINPFDNAEMEILGGYVVAAGFSPVLALPAGLDAYESEDISQAFRALSISQLIVTRCDLARRLGGVLGAALHGNIKLTVFGDGPEVGQILKPFTSLTLAQSFLNNVSLNKDYPHA